jgi:putative membrane protein
MKKTLIVIAATLALVACKKEEPYDFGSSTAQATGTVRAPDQPINPPITTMAGSTTTAAADVSGDQGFVQNAALGGLAEVELSKLAVNKATNAEVKQFAQMMVGDHTGANSELKTLAAAKGIALPTELDADHKATRDRLNTLSGAAFDRDYMAAMAADHNNAVTLFQNEATSGTDAELKAFAAKTLPKLQQHQTMASSVAAKVSQ